ncbi:hypothetical protein GCM10011578_076310 [Streptomyces fuscichromogenes]|uniref:Uncharacterized protein n=1 Tax=Streptomyces fuscichromogenes TaxID=1324013 RepID=A0A918CVJ2_9ACTN|nr:hypothetical protein GCM10011578_076310 [Streptomyces fuscichromogenes]
MGGLLAGEALHTDGALTKENLALKKCASDRRLAPLPSFK